MLLRNVRPQPLTFYFSPRRHARAFILSSLHPIVLAPAVFTGLTLSLWAYKCLMMITFQNKIIYMPNVPPFSRSEKISDYALGYTSLSWRTETLRTSDSKTLTILTATRKTPSPKHRLKILYLQGNASSLPPRVPSLSRILAGLSPDIGVDFYALSYRGFWTSTGTPTPRGIETDVECFLKKYSISAPDTRLVVWGQSIGCGIAARGLSTTSIIPDAMILETPFLSVGDVVRSLYPQKWLPYRYIGGFVKRGGWDMRVSKDAGWRVGKGGVLLVEAGGDEVLGEGMGAEVEGLVGEGVNEGGVRRIVVEKALHSEAVVKAEGRREVGRFLEEVSRGE